ncbi:MAG: addiction module toxin RelE [Acidobacteriota bacterium]|jgi:putative transposase
MARPPRIEFPGALYLVTSAAGEGRAFFSDDRDRIRFFMTLLETVDRWRWIVHGYCLLQDRYQLLVETPEGILSRGMRQLNGEYTQGINRRRSNSGAVVARRFKSILVEKKTSLAEVCRYMLLAPVRESLSPTAALWAWSSLRATAGLCDPPPFLTTRDVLRRFHRNTEQARQAFADYIREGEENGAPLPKVHSGLWIGSERFGAGVMALRRSGGKAPAVYEEDRPPLDSFFPPHILANRNKRNLRIYDAYSKGRYTLQEIGSFLGLHIMTISRIVRAGEVHEN